MVWTTLRRRDDEVDGNNPTRSKIIGEIDKKSVQIADSLVVLLLSLVVVDSMTFRLADISAAAALMSNI